MRLFIKLVPINKIGNNIGDMCQCIREIGNHKHGDVVISKNDSYLVSAYWQAMQLLIFGDTWPSKDDIMVYDLTLCKFITKEVASNYPEEGIRKAVASYPHIVGTIDFTPYVDMYIKMNGKVNITIDGGVLKID